MTDFNLFLLVIGGMTLGALALAIIKEGRETPLRRWEYAMIAVAAFIIMYGIEHMPNLGG